MSLVRALELIGSFTFGVSGGMLAARKGYDAVGVVGLALTAALGGGIMRDVVLGDTPPRAFRDVVYLLPPLGAAAAVFVAHHLVDRFLRRPVAMFDAIGLGMFTVNGSLIALEAGVGIAPAVLMGVGTAAGGGIVRDVLAREDVAVFRPDTTLYTIPAAIGATTVAVTWRAGVYNDVIGTSVAVGVAALRALAVRHGITAPTPRPPRAGRGAP